MVYNFEEFYVETINDFVGGFGSAPTAGGSASRLLILSLVCYTDAWLLIYIYIYIYMYICRESEREREREIIWLISLQYITMVLYIIASYHIILGLGGLGGLGAGRQGELGSFGWLVGWFGWFCCLYSCRCYLYYSVLLLILLLFVALAARQAPRSSRRPSIMIWYDIMMYTTIMI